MFGAQCLAVNQSRTCCLASFLCYNQQWVCAFVFITGWVTLVWWFKTEICIWNCWAVQSKHTKGKNVLILIRLHKMCACFPGNPFFKQQTHSTLTNSDKSKLSAYRFQLVLASVEQTTLFQISEAFGILKECFSDVPLFSCWKQSFETRVFFSIFISKFVKTLWGRPFYFSFC